MGPGERPPAPISADHRKQKQPDIEELIRRAERINPRTALELRQRISKSQQFMKPDKESN